MLKFFNAENLRQKLRFLPEAVLKKLPLAALVAEIVAAMLLYAYMIGHLPTQNGDNIEHIHSSFLVAEGKVPYRDFFQHHNPLLWYLFAPIARLFAYNSIIVEVAGLVSLLVFLKSVVYVYRIIDEFFLSRIWAIAGAAVLMVPWVKLYALDFRPDNYMVCALVGGLYYYFCYLKDAQRRRLVAAFALFFLAFLLAQKALFPLAVLGISALYFWSRGQIKGKDMAAALVLPVLGSAAFFLYLFHYDMFELYFRSNYMFNLALAEGFERTRIADAVTNMQVVIVLGGIGILCFWHKPTKFEVIAAALYVTELLQRAFYFSPYSYYYWMLFYFAVLCAAAAARRLKLENTGGLLVVAAGLGWLLYGAAVFHLAAAKRSEKQPYLPEYISRRINPCDYVFNGDGMMYNLFGKDPAYYWQLIGQLDVIGEKTGIKPMPDVNALIEQLKPKFIYGKSYFDKFANEGGRQKIVHYVDREMVEKFYEPTPFGGVYQLKADYDKRKCRKKEGASEWRYEE